MSDVAKVASAAVLVAICGLPLPAQEPEGADRPPPRIAANLAERQSRREAFRDKAVQDAVRAALGFLVAHQDEDGRWDCAGFMKHDRRQHSDGPGNATCDIGVSALALLALLADADPRDRENVERGVDWLVGQQAPASGSIGVHAPGSQGFIYGHAMASLAIVEALALLGRERWRPPAEKALAYLLVHRSPNAAWRYEAGGSDNDTSVTSWCMAALCTGWRTGFALAPATLAQPLAWLDSVTDRDGACGYQRPGEGSSRQSGDLLRRFPTDKGEAMAAAAMFCRLQCGGDPAQAMQVAASERLLAHLPLWEPGAIDFYYWFHGSQAMSQTGKEQRERWFRALDRALLPNQRRDGACAGSWDPCDPWGTESGRIGATAFAVLSLQARYRVGDLQPLLQLPPSPAFAALRTEWSGNRMGAVLQRMEAIDRAALTADEREALARLRFQLEVEMLRVKINLVRRREAAEPDWLALCQLLERVREEYRGVPLGDQAGQELAGLQQREDVRQEVEAGRRLQALRDKPPREKKQLVQELHKLVQQHPGTRAAREAGEWLRVLERK